MIVLRATATLFIAKVAKILKVNQKTGVKRNL